MSENTPPAHEYDPGFVTRAMAERGPALNAKITQLEDAQDLLALEADEYVGFPWADLNGLVNGGIAPSEIVGVMAFSGNGKTSFTFSLLDSWTQEGRRVYVMPLETPPKLARVVLACKRLGIDSGDALRGKLRGTPEGQEKRRLLGEELERQGQYPIWFDDAPFLDVESLTMGMLHARDLGADWFVIDHIDHIMPGGGNGFAASQAVINQMKQMADRTGLRVLYTSQLNNDAVRGDGLAQFFPPKPEHVFMGPVKRFVSSLQLGLYRPLRLNVPREEQEDYKKRLKLARAKLIPAQEADVLEPNTMGVVMMKDRAYGREGRRCFLDIRAGIVSQRFGRLWWEH